jgi:HEPN domain-containing protein
MRKEVERLLRQADRDLENARKNISIDAYEVSAFLAHQATEKYLKAAWMVLKRRRAPFTHSLVELADGLGLPQALRRHVLSLNPDYTVTRYPDAANGVPFELYDAEIARAKINSARQVIRWARGKIRR